MTNSRNNKPYPWYLPSRDVLGVGFCFFLFTLLAFVGCADGDRMRRDLALLQERNQGDSLLTDSVLAQRLADYFDRHGSQNERLEAHYLLARTWADLGQAPRALDAFHTAAEQADTTRLDSLGCHWLSRIYGQMAKLLDDQIIPDKTLTALRQAIRYARLANEKTIALNYVEQQVRPYYDLGMYDSVYSICSQLSMDYQREGMKEEAIHAQGSRIYVDLLKGNYSNLDTLLTGYLKAVRTLGYDEGYAYSLKAKYHQGTGNLDSAIICYRRQLELTEVLAEKTVPYRGLYQCYKALGRSDSANKYNELYCMANDSSVIFKYRTTMQRMQHLYDYSHFQTMAHQKSLENERLHSSLYALAALLVLIIAVGIAIFKRIQTKKEQAIRSINATYYNKMAVYNQLQKDFYRLVEQESVNKELLNKIRTELEEKERELAKYTAAEQLRALADDLDNPLLQALHQKAAIGCKALKKDKEELGRLLSADYIKLHSLLMEKSAMLSEEEYMVCVLVRFNFIPSEISSLLNLSSQTVTNIRTRLLKKLFGVSGGAKDFDQALVEYR